MRCPGAEPVLGRSDGAAATGGRAARRGLFDEQEALQPRQPLMDEGRSVVDRTRTATEQHTAEIAKLNELLQAGAIDQASYARAVEDANDRALRSSQAWTDSATRFLKDEWLRVSTRRPPQSAHLRARSGAEDSLVGFISSGKLEFPESHRQRPRRQHSF